MPVQNPTKRQMLRLVINEALEQLPELQRRMVQLRIEGYSTAEIAKETDRCRRTVERVLRQFREYMSDYIEHDHVADNTSQT